MYVPAAKDTREVDNHFTFSEHVVYLYALGYFLAEVAQFKNLLCENFRASSFRDIIAQVISERSPGDENQISRAKSLLATSVEQFITNANLVDFCILLTFLTTYILRMSYMHQYLPVLAATAQIPDPSRYLYALNCLLLTYKLIDMLKFVSTATRYL